MISDSIRSSSLRRVSLDALSLHCRGRPVSVAYCLSWAIARERKVGVVMGLVLGV